MLSGKRCLFLSLGLSACFVLASLAASIGFSAPGQVTVSAGPAPTEAVLTGRDEPGRPATELLPGVLIDLNTAAPEELQLLPGIGASLSLAIVEYREANGPFQRPEDITQVPGIGEKRYEAIADKITTGDGA